MSKDSNMATEKKTKYGGKLTNAMTMQKRKMYEIDNFFRDDNGIQWENWE